MIATTFLYVLYFIIDTLALVCYLTVFLSPLGAVIDFLGNGLYFIICLIRYGRKKTAERFFNFKKKPFKKVVRLIGGSIIPYVHL